MPTEALQKSKPAYIKLGRKIYRRRVQLQYSRSLLADKCGITTQYIHRIEKGDRFPSQEVMSKLAQHLSFKLDYSAIVQFPEA